MDIVLRAVFAYVFIQFVLRVVGRRELSSMEPSDIVLLVVMGDLIQNGVTQSDYSMTGVVLAVATFGLLSVATSWLVFRSRRASEVIEGIPLIIVEDGKTLDSIACEGALVADGVARGRTTVHFAGEQAEELWIQSSNLADAFTHRRVAPGNERATKAAARKAAQLAATLKRLDAHPDDRSVGAEVERALKKAGNCP